MTRYRWLMLARSTAVKAWSESADLLRNLIHSICLVIPGFAVAWGKNIIFLPLFLANKKEDTYFMVRHRLMSFIRHKIYLTKLNEMERLRI